MESLIAVSKDPEFLLHSGRLIMESAVQVMELLKRTYSNYLPMAIAKDPEFLPFISDNYGVSISF